MIFLTNNQLNCFLVFLFFGIICGIIYQLFCIIFLKKYQKNIIKSVFNGIFCTFFCIFYIFLINFFNFGKFPLALILAFLVGFFWIEKLLRNLVVFLQNKWYTCIKRRKNEKSNNKS